MDFLKGEGLDIDTTCNFWKYSDVLNLNWQTADATKAEFEIEDGELMLEKSAHNKQQQKHKRAQRSRATKQTPEHFYQLPAGPGRR